MRREDVFEALTAKALKQTMKQVTAGLDGIITAAAAPEPDPSVSLPSQPSSVAPPFSVTMLEGAVMATWNTFAETELVPFLVDTFLDSAGAVAKGAGKVVGETIDVLSSDFAVQALSLAQNRMKGIGAQLWSQIQDQLTEGFAAGESIEQLAARLSTVAGLSTPRALVTARTEVIGAANAGAYEQMVFAGFTDEEVQKEWLATEDPRTRESHRNADGQKVALHQPFVVDVVHEGIVTGTENLNFPGDPLGSAGNVINCRCSIAFVFDDDAQEQDEPVTAAGFDESKVKRDGEGKFAKKASRALGGLDKLTGKVQKPGKPVMLRTKVLFGTTYVDGAIIAVKPDSNERIIWDAPNEKVLRQKKNADGKYETVETLTRGATYAKYGNETGWQTHSGEASAPAPAPDPSPTTPTAPKVAESASEGVAETTPKTDIPDVDKHPVDPAIIRAQSADPAIPGGALLLSDQGNGVVIRKGFGYGTAPAAVIIYKDEKTFKIIKPDELQSMSDDDLQTAYDVVVATPSKLSKSITKTAGGALPPAGTAPNSAPIFPIAPKAATLPSAQDVILAQLKKSTVDTTPKTKIPAISDMKPTGKQVGTHWGQIYEDKDGDQWLVKQSSSDKQSYVVAGDVAYQIHELAGLPTPVGGVVQVAGLPGNIQKMFPNVKTLSPTTFKPESLSQTQILQLQKEHVFDWLVSNHDAHAGNLLKDSKGNLIGIDKDQAFRWLGSDKLSLDFKPNPHEQAALKMYKAHQQGKLAGAIGSPTTGELHDFIIKLQDIPDEQYRQLLLPYAKAAKKDGKLAIGGPAYLGLKSSGFPPNDIDAFLDAAVQRKNNLLADYTKFIKSVEAGKIAPAVAPSSPPASISTNITITAPSGAVSTLTKTKPIKMTHGLLQNPKTTQYVHAQVIAEKPADNTRLVWDGKKNKFALERKTLGSGAWYTDSFYSKQAAYKKFGGQDGWVQPTVVNVTPSAGATAGTAPTPTVAGNPVAPAIVVPTPAVKKTKFNTAALLAQDKGVVLYEDHLTKSQQLGVASKFKHGTPGAAINTSSQGSKMFKGLLLAQNYLNSTPAVKNGTVPPATLYQTLKIVDKNSWAYLAGDKDLYEKAIVAWLQSPAGKSNAQKYIDENDALGIPKTPEQIAAAKAKAAATAAANATQTDALTTAIHASLPTIGKPDANETTFPEMADYQALVMQQQMQSISPWTAGQAAAIKTYTGQSYSAINSSLRKKNAKGNDYTPQLSSLKTAEKIQAGMRPVTQSLTVYRGTGGQQFGLGEYPTAAQLQALVGKKVIDKGFVSTSVGTGAAFGGALRLEIQVPKGTPAAYVQSVSKHKTERELLLAAGTKFEILEVVPAGSPYGTSTVKMRVIA